MLICSCCHLKLGVLVLCSHDLAFGVIYVRWIYTYPYGCKP
uniref:Uncharacterized protein n=1 Tax=Rhizophora mucronata TaxID=61149 RepID=A0A2P2PJ39_RHIMU